MGIPFVRKAFCVRIACLLLFLFHNFGSQKVSHFIRIIRRALVWYGVLYFIQTNNGFAFKTFYTIRIWRARTAHCSLFGVPLCVYIMLPSTIFYN